MSATGMTMFIRTIFTIGVIVAGPLAGISTLQAQDDCKKIITAYIEEMASVQAPGPGQAYHVHFTTESISADPRKTQSSTVEAHVYMDRSHMTYQTGQMMMMRDAQDAFMVIYPQKKIIWAKGGLNPAESTERISLGGIQKNLVEKASVSFCRTETKAGQSVKVIGLVPDQETAEKVNVSAFTFYYSPAFQKMQKVTIEFTKPHPMQRQTITYHTIDFDYKAFKPKPFYAQVFASQGVLHQKYQGYMLVDNKNAR
jgi:hypothetical protein